MVSINTINKINYSKCDLYECIILKYSKNQYQLNYYATIIGVRFKFVISYLNVIFMIWLFYQIKLMGDSCSYMSNMDLFRGFGFFF